ncbi:MAG: metallophosphoesterase family protein [Desulfobaccales bacterium]
MKRREFLLHLGMGLAAGWVVGPWRPASAPAALPGPRLALLADAHLPDGDARRAPVRALTRAVAEIKRLHPAPDVVLFAGDLAHAGDPRALALGQEILADLPAPLAAVMGEGDSRGRGARAWNRRFGESRFSRPYPGFHLLGLQTSLTTSPQGPLFEVGQEQRGWLAWELARVNGDKPLVVLSHAPLQEIYRPWGQWTRDGALVMHLLSRFPRVYCFHGHVHTVAVSSQLSAFSQDLLGPDDFFFRENGKQKTENLSLPATAWPLPSPLQGTPAAARPGLGSAGCGWGLVSLGDKSLEYRPQLWQA